MQLSVIFSLKNVGKAYDLYILPLYLADYTEKMFNDCAKLARLDNF